MVWVVCSGLIPPYNSGGGGVVVVGGGVCSNAPCQNEQYFVAESVCFCLTLYLVIAG